MLEKPDLPEAKIADWLLQRYGLPAARVEFLPTNYQNTAAYRAVDDRGAAYFLKLRREAFDETSVRMPLFLKETGLRQILPPLPTLALEYWGVLEDFHAILYPFVDGHNAFEVPLREAQWLELGSALRRIHSTRLPPGLQRQIARENYSPDYRQQVRTLLERVRRERFAEPRVAEFAAFMQAKAGEILHLVRRADQLGSLLQSRPPNPVLCHSDLHAGNLLCPSDGRLLIVDWDNPILAPKERDLMFIGGGVGGIWNSAREEALFYRGYGETKIDPLALAYYRCERILQDIGPLAEQWLAPASDPDRRRSLPGIAGFFLPGGVVEMAHRAERALPADLSAA